jgi:hypothetical protein
MSNLRAIVGPTGGLGYHLAAWRFRDSWSPLTDRLRQWLQAWNPPEKQLILFGPSAGYTLPRPFLERFDVIRAIEPDPIARLLLKTRFPSLRTRLSFVDAESVLPWWHEGEAAPGAPLEAFLAQAEALHGTPAVLFSNVLGQLPLLQPNFEDEKLREAFLKAISRYSWASYHDLFSGRAKDFDRCPDSVSMAGDVETMARKFFRNEASINDHGTTWLGAGRTISVCRWPFNPKHHHVIAFVSQLRT